MCGRLIAVTAAFAALAAGLGPATALAGRCAGAPGGGLTLANVASDGDRFLGVGSNGLIARSADGSRWTVEESGVEHDLRGAVWTGERWVVVGDVGTILHRESGSWVPSVGIPSVGLRGVAAKPGLVAASGSAGTVVTSPDGVQWSVGDSGTSEILWGGTSSAGSQLLLSGKESTVIATSDGSAFSPVSTFPAPTDSTAAPRPFLWQLGSDGETVVAVGDFGAILNGTLANGLNAMPSPTDEILRGVGFANGRWVAVGSGGDALYSDNGRRWRLGSAPTTVDLRGVAYNGRRWVAVGDQSTAISSANGERWRVDVTAMPCALLGLARSGARVLAVGGGGRILRSNAGENWRRSDSPTNADLYGATRGPGLFVAVGSDGAIITSTDRRRWVERESPVDLNLHTVHWTGDEFLAGGDRGEVIRSQNGKRWRSIEFPAFHSVRGFATGGGSVVAAGAGTIAQRDPGETEWELEQAGTGKFQTGVAYGGGRFVIVGHNGEALVSEDGGESWVTGVSGVEVNLDAVTWTGDHFLATGEGIAITSVDGLTWQPQEVPTVRSLRALLPFEGDVIAVGDGNTRVTLPGG